MTNEEILVASGSGLKVVPVLYVPFVIYHLVIQLSKAAIEEIDDFLDGLQYDGVVYLSVGSYYSFLGKYSVILELG